MSLENRIEDDLKTAMRNKDAETLSVLRMVKSAITNEKIAKKTEDLKDDQVMAIVQKQAKQRLESIASFEKAGRAELAAKEKSEFELLEKYLPKQLTDEELRQIVEETVKETGAQSKADTGKVMGAIMPKIKGHADGKRVNVILAELLA